MSAIDGAWEKGENWEKVVRLAIDAGGDLTWNNYHYGSVAKAIFANGSVDLCKYYIDALARQGLLDAVFFEDQTPLAIAKAQRTTHPEVILYLEQMIEQYRIHET